MCDPSRRLPIQARGGIWRQASMECLPSSKVVRYVSCWPHTLAIACAGCVDIRTVSRCGVCECLEHRISRSRLGMHVCGLATRVAPCTCTCHSAFVSSSLGTTRAVHAMFRSQHVHLPSATERAPHIECMVSLTCARFGMVVWRSCVVRPQPFRHQRSFTTHNERRSYRPRMHALLGLSA